MDRGAASPTQIVVSAIQIALAWTRRALPVVLAACVSLDGLSEPEPGVGDVTSTGGSKGAKVADGGVLEAASTSEGTRSWCEGRSSAFCADFDRSADPGSGWTSRSDLRGGLTLASDGAQSTTLRARVDALPLGATGQALLRKELHAAPRDITVAFDARIEQIGASSGGRATLATLAFGSDWQLSVDAFAGGASSIVERFVKASDGGVAPLVTPSPNGSAGSHGLPKLPLDRWFHVELRVRADAAVNLTLDGMVVFAGTASVRPPSVPPRVVLGLAVEASAPSTMWSVRYDDVEVTTR